MRRLSQVHKDKIILHLEAKGLKVPPAHVSDMMLAIDAAVKTVAVVPSGELPLAHFLLPLTHSSI